MISPKPNRLAWYVVVGEVLDTWVGSSEVVSCEARANGPTAAKMSFHAVYDTGHTTTYIEAVYGPFERIETVE